MTVQERVEEHTTKLVYQEPMTFGQFLDSFGSDDFVELVNGSVVEKEMVQLDHERLYHWLAHVLRSIIKERDLGILLGSRTAVEIDEYRGRLPDLLFVRKDRMSIVRQKGVYGTPDLVIEIISPGDRPSNLTDLEVDYRRIGVPEILFIDQKRRVVRFVERGPAEYQSTSVSSGPLTLKCLADSVLHVEWLFEDPLPDETATVAHMLGR